VLCLGEPEGIRWACQARWEAIWAHSRESGWVQKWVSIEGIQLGQSGGPRLGRPVGIRWVCQAEWEAGWEC
jgi:hypothetical protein